MANKIWIGNDTGNEGDWATAANWSPSGVPTDGDDVFLTNSSQSVTEGFNQSAVALASLNIDQTFTGAIGDASNYLQIGTAILNIGLYLGSGVPQGSGRIKINLGSTTTATVNIYNSGQSLDTNLPAIRLLMAKAADTVNILKGSVGIACQAGETSTVGTINTNGDGKTWIGAGVTLTTLTKNGGAVQMECAATTINNYAGDLKIFGTGAITTLNAFAGNVESSSAGTITTANVRGPAIVDFTKSLVARTVTTLNLSNGGTIKRDTAVVTITTLNVTGVETLKAA
jgi:hypothetical protein